MRRPRLLPVLPHRAPTATHITDHMILVRPGEQCKRLLSALMRSDPPPETARAQFRRYKPEQCPSCGYHRLDGHGWRSRSLLYSWNHWDTLWYWRVQCDHCGSTIRIVFDVSCPELLYCTAVVLAVIVGRHQGESAHRFAPHPTTQRRWLSRFEQWWVIALALGAVEGDLESWCERPSHLLEALHRCAAGGVSLVAPSHAPLTRPTPRGGFQRPVISAPQGCLFHRVGSLC